jgi:hypothetical protein
MLSVKGTFHGGVVTPSEPVGPELEGREVTILIPEPAPPLREAPNGPMDAPESDPFLELIDRCRVATGIGNLAHQHHHYLYGTPRKPPADA